MKKIYNAILMLLLTFFLASCMYDLDNDKQQNNDIGEYEAYSGYFSSMGTVITLQVYETSEAKANDIYNNVKAIYDKYDNISDDGYDSIFGQNYESELAILNRDRELKVSNELYNLLKFAVDMQDETNGYFNPFMGELNHEWKDYINYKGSMPSDFECSFFTNIANYTYLTFGDDNLVTICNDETENTALIDLGGIAKGYATNEAYKYLKENVKYYLLNAGSSNLLMSEKPNQENYKVVLSYVYGYPNSNPKIEIVDGYWYIDGRNTKLEALDNANSSYGSDSADKIKNAKDGDLYFLINSQNSNIYIRENGYWRNKLTLGLCNLNVRNNAVVTSSPAEQNRFENNIYYHHLISPLTGKPVNYVNSITVIGEDSGYLDAMSTALYVMSDDVREKYINEHDLKVIISNNGQISYVSEGIDYEI